MIVPKTVRALGEDDLEQMFAVREVAFLEPSDLSDPETLRRYKDRLPYTRGHFEEGTLTSVYTLFPFEMYLAGKRVKMGGLAGIASKPEYRRRGHIARLLEDALEQLRVAGVGWCLEYPFDSRFYARYGWQSVHSGALVEVPSERFLVGRAPNAVRLKAEDVQQLKPIHKRWARGYNFTLSRDDGARPEWSRLVQRPWKERERFIYKLEEAYCLLEFRDKAEQTVLEVHDYAYSSPAGRRDLFAFLGSFYGQVDVISLHLPSDEPRLLDWQAYVRKNTHALQARVVDVTLALEALPCPFETSFVLRVEDDFCDWNSQVFQVTLGEKNKVAQGQSTSPDLSLDIRALALLLSGSLSAEVARRAGMLEGDVEAASALTSLAGGRTSFMPLSDYF